MAGAACRRPRRRSVGVRRSRCGSAWSTSTRRRLNKLGRASPKAACDSQINRSASRRPCKSTNHQSHGLHTRPRLNMLMVARKGRVPHFLNTLITRHDDKCMRYGGALSPPRISVPAHRQALPKLTCTITCNHNQYFGRSMAATL